MKPTEILHPEQRRASKTYLANELREAIFTWRKQNYPGATETSKDYYSIGLKKIIS